MTINEESFKAWEQDHIEFLTSREMGEWLHRRDINAKRTEKPSGEWIPINEETIKTLQDHHYYLVAHKYFNTPMKAKYHNDCNKHFEVFFSKGSQIAHIFFESTDDITHFMELPELPEREEAAADE